MVFNNNLLLGSSGAAGAGGFAVDNSIMFNNDDSEYLTRTPSEAGSQRTWTFSFWYKFGSLTGRQMFFSQDEAYIDINENSSTSALINIYIVGTSSPGWYWETVAQFRDPHAWSHVCIAFDSRVAAGRSLRVYINGDELTSFTKHSTGAVNNQHDIGGTSAMFIGAGNSATPAGFYDGYLAQYAYVNGAQLPPTNFGETDDNGVWRPIELTDTLTASTTAEAISNVTSGKTGTGATTYTFSSVSLGTATPNRAVYIFVSAQDPEGDNMSVSSITVGGKDGKVFSIVDSGAEAHYGSELWKADIPTGTSADIVVTWDQPTSQCGIIVWSVTGDHFLYDLKKDVTNSTSSVSFTGVPDNSVILAGKAGTGGRRSTWSSAVDENVDENIDSSGVYHTGASKAHSTGGSFTVTCTPDDTDTRPRMIAIVLSPYQGMGTGGFYLPFTNSAGLGQDDSGSTAETKVQENTYSAGSEVNKSDMDIAGFTAGAKLTAVADAALPTVKIRASSTGFSSVTVRIETDSGTGQAPSGTLVDSNAEVTGITSSGAGLKTADFPNGGPVLVAGTTYWIVLAQTGNWGWQHDVSGSGGALGIRDGSGYQAGRGLGHEAYQLGNIFTPVNSPTQSGDSPTKNYAVLSPLSLQANIALSEGNLKQVSSSNSQGLSLSSFPVKTGQKVYIEATLTNTGGETGCLKATATTAGNPSKTFDNLDSGDARLLNVNNGDVFTHDGAALVSNYAPNQTNPTTHMIALDLVNDKIYWGDASVGSSGWSNGSGSYNQAFSSAVGVDLDANLDWFFAFKGYNATIAVNFGQTAFTVSPPTGYSSGYSAAIEYEASAPAIEDGTAFFQPTLYEGNGGSQSITQDGTSGENFAKNSTFKPDLLWTKKVGTGTGGNALFDVVRTNASGQFLRSDNDDEEKNEAGFASFDVKGFSWDGAGTEVDINSSSKDYVAWQWLTDNTAGGSSNSDGTITGGTTISVNTTSGFSIVKWTGDNVDGATIGHGLGKPPAMMIYRKIASAQWMVQHAGCTGGVANGSSTKQLMLEATDGEGGPFSGGHIDFENSGDGSSTVTLQKASTFNNCNASSAPYISYMFAEIPGFSKFGSFEGNGASGSGGDGPFIELGFRPALFMWKNIDSSTNGHWVVMDTSRNRYNVADGTLWWNRSNAEDTGEAKIDFLSNGVKNRGGTSARYNADGQTFIYAAWAENPFAGTSPLTAR